MPETRLPARRSHALPLVGLLLAAFALLATACGAISAIIDTQDALEDEGFTNVDLSYESNNGTTTIEVDADAPSGDSTQEAQDQAAEVVWTEFPRDLDAVEVTIDGETTSYSRSEMEDEFGERPEGLDDEDISDDARGVLIGTAIAIGVGALLCIGLIILIIVLVRRSRKKRRQQQQFGPPPGYGGPPPGGYPPQGPPPGGYPPAGTPPPPQGPQQGSSF